MNLKESLKRFLLLYLKIKSNTLKLIIQLFLGCQKIIIYLRSTCAKLATILKDILQTWGKHLWLFQTC